MKTYFCGKCFDNDNKLLASTKEMQHIALNVQRNIQS